MDIALSILVVLACIFLILVILLQSGKKAGIGSIGGASESFMSKSKARSWDAKLEKLTAVIIVILVVAVVAINIVIK